MEQKMIYVGIDWADDHHDILITDDSAKTLDQFRIDHTCDGFALLHSHLANHQMSPGHLLRTDRHLFQPIKPLPEDYRLLDRLCSDLRKAVDEKSRVINQVISCLKEFYPKALETFSLNSQIFIDFLKAFPDHGTLRACTKKAFLTFLKKHRYPYPSRAEELWKVIQSPALQPDRVIARSGKLRLGMLLGQLENLKEHITHYEQEAFLNEVFRN